MIPKPPVFGDFATRIRDYLKLHKSIPKLRTTTKSEKIAEHPHELAETIKAARANAKAGDIFTPDIARQFKEAIAQTFHAPAADDVRKTIRQGEPLKGWNLSVNAEMPDAVPTTTVPPNLLLHLPSLPPDLAYRIIGHDFVLEDLDARLIVDFITGAVP